MERTERPIQQFETNMKQLIQKHTEVDYVFYLTGTWANDFNLFKFVDSVCVIQTLLQIFVSSL